MSMRRATRSPTARAPSSAVRALAVVALAVVALAIAACSSPPPTGATPTPTAEPGVLTVTALLDLSGPRATIGAQQRNALQLWLDQQQGRTGVPVKVRTVDVAGSEAKLLIELRRAAAEDLADAVIVGASVVYDDTFARAVEVAALPVLLAQPLASDPVVRIGGRWAFSLAPPLERLAAAEIEDAIARGVLVPSLVLTDRSDRIDPMAAALAAELERRRIDPLTRIAMPIDGSVPPVVRSSLSVLRSVHCTAVISACSAVAHEARSTSSPAFFYLSYFTAPSEIKDDRDLASRAVWPSTRALIPLSVLRQPYEHARAEFLKRYGERTNAVPSIHAAIAYDALTLLAAAAADRGADDRTVLRNALEGITMPLIATTYSFSEDRHAGADPRDLAHHRWNGSGTAVEPALDPSLGTGLTTPTRSPIPRLPAAPSPSATP